MPWSIAKGRPLAKENKGCLEGDAATGGGAGTQPTASITLSPPFEAYRDTVTRKPGGPDRTEVLTHPLE